MDKNTSDIRGRCLGLYQQRNSIELKKSIYIIRTLIEDPINNFGNLETVCLALFKSVSLK